MERKRIKGNIETAWRGHEDYAYTLVEFIKPEVTVDLGVDFGFSTIAWALPNIGTVYGIDWFKGDDHAGIRNAKQVAEQHIADNEVTNVVLIEGDFFDVAKTWDKSIDILHIDGFHSYDFTKSVFEVWSKFVRPGGIILFHDTMSFPNDVGRFFNEIQGAKFNFTHSHGLGVFTTPV